VIQLPIGLGAADVPTITALVTAVVGAFVAYQAHRGYRRNESRSMLALAVGILLLTTGPFLLRQALMLGGVADGASAALAVQAARVAGLVVLLYAIS